MLNKKEFTYADGAAVYLLAVLADLALQVLVAIVFNIVGTEYMQIDWVNIIVSAFLQAAFILCIFLYCRMKKTTPDFGFKKTHPANYALAAAVALVSLVCFYCVAVAFDLLLQVTGYESGVGFEFTSLPAKILGVLATCIAAPIGEELIFRGALLSGLKKNFKTPIAVLLSGLAFSLMHMNPEQTVYQFLLGCALAYMTVTTGSVIPAMIGHAVSNLIAVSMEIAVPFGNAVNAAFDFLLSVPWLFAVLTVVLFAAGAAAVFFTGRFMEKLGGKRMERNFTSLPPSENEDKTGESEQSLLKKPMFGARAMLIAGLAICAVLWILMLIMGYVHIEGM